jgi:hypothetical protein
MSRPPKGIPCKTPEERKDTKQEWYQKNREKVIAHYAGQAEKRRETSKKWDLANPERKRENSKRAGTTPAGKDREEHDRLIRRFREHGLTLDQYHTMVESQNFCCAICGEEPKTDCGGSHDGFHIDHNHKTDEVRGLLCGEGCNQGLGMFRDSPELLEKAVDYLRKHE